MDYFPIINGIPYKKISGNGRKRNLEKIDDYLNIEGIQNNMLSYATLMYMNITWVSSANKETVTKRGTQQKTRMRCGRKRLQPKYGKSKKNSTGK